MEVMLCLLFESLKYFPYHLEWYPKYLKGEGLYVTFYLIFEVNSILLYTVTIIAMLPVLIYPF